MALPPSCRTALAAALLAATAHATRAQVLRGAVRDSASRRPIPGVVVVLMDSGGRALTRDITDARGQYAVSLTAAMRGGRRLRIGFSPRDIRLSPPAADTTNLDVAMLAIPTLLSTVAVVDQPECPRRDDRATAFALWEQTKAALLATVVARDADPATVVRLRYDRRLRDDHIVSQRVQIDSVSTERPFVAPRPAAAFVEDGFVFDSAGLTWYSGPDADVMLDDAFARGDCFAVAPPDAGRETEVGPGFTRASRQRGRVDIEGVVWIDSVSRSLTDIVFRYVGLSRRAERVRPGGPVSFRAVDGTAMIDRWSLRFPAEPPGPEPPPSVAAMYDRQLEARESGGEVVLLALNAPSAANYVAVRCRIDVHAMTAGVLVVRAIMPNGEPAVGAHVEAQGVAHGAPAPHLAEGTTDANGLFHVCRAPRGTPLRILVTQEGAVPAMVAKELTADVGTVKVQLRPAHPRQQ